MFMHMCVFIKFSPLNAYKEQYIAQWSIICLWCSKSSDQSHLTDAMRYFLVNASSPQLLYLSCGMVHIKDYAFNWKEYPMK